MLFWYEQSTAVLVFDEELEEVDERVEYADDELL